MSSHRLRSLVGVAALAAAFVALISLVTTIATAQAPPPPKWELFGGYSFVYPGTDVHGLLPGGILPASSPLESNPRGIGASITYDFNRWVGLTGDISGQWGSGEKGIPAKIDDADFYGLTMGPKFTLRRRYFSPFLEVLVGDDRMISEVFGRDDRFGFMAGGGLDLDLSRHFAIRLIRADYRFSNHQFGPDSTVPATDERGVRLQSGVVFMFGGKELQPNTSASCSVNPGEILVGEPATATAVPSNFNSRHTLDYSWSTSGGQLSGKGGSASINTNGLAGGSYTITAHISDPKIKNGSYASCMAAFLVKELPKTPPTIACSANPPNLQSGAQSAISCTCSSRDGVPVTVGGWTASGGSVSGASGNTAVLETSGVSPGSIAVKANCSDPRGLSAQATAMVLVDSPPVSQEFIQLENRLALHSIYFPTAQPRITLPDGGLLASQEQTLVSLAADFQKYLETKPDAHLTLEGHADPRATVEYNQALSERRVDRTKQFLVEHGVPAANIETKAFGEQKNLTEDQVRDAVEKNPELTPEQRQRVLGNMQTILLASNRRVDVTLNSTGQRSVREYPFNASDSLTLIRQEGTKKVPRHAPPR
jgi:hypothetical protein